jgi:plasmid segregation protein ParM
MSVNHSFIPEAGIDVGFFSTKLTVGTVKDGVGAVILTDLFPSWAVRTSTATTIGQGSQLGFKSVDGVTIEVEGMQYFVGKSALNASSGVDMERSPNENYSQTPEYRALFLGALYYIAEHHKVNGSLTIESLCVGLPVATFSNYRKELALMSSGTHTIPCPSDHSKSIKVHIKKCNPVIQPQGAAISYALINGTRMGERRVVVLDIGGGTIDWFFLDEFVPNMSRSGATQMGVLSCVKAICDQIDSNFVSDPLILDRVNKTLIKNLDLLEVDGRMFPMKDLWPSAQAVLIRALNEMAKSVGNFRAVDRFIFTGGGANILAKAAVAETSVLADQERKFVVDKDPVFSNVRGFHVMAQLYGDSR